MWPMAVVSASMAVVSLVKSATSAVASFVNCVAALPMPILPALDRRRGYRSTAICLMASPLGTIELASGAGRMAMAICSALTWSWTWSPNDLASLAMLMIVSIVWRLWVSHLGVCLNRSG